MRHVLKDPKAKTTTTFTASTTLWYLTTQCLILLFNFSCFDALSPWLGLYNCELPEQRPHLLYVSLPTTISRVLATSMLKKKRFRVNGVQGGSGIFHGHQLRSRPEWVLPL